jgi:hypothetical protein
MQLTLQGASVAIYVDDEQIPWRGKLWCHLVADSLAELHSFAGDLGLKRAWFQEKSVYPHYDVTLGVRDRAIALGAVMGDRRTIIDCAKLLKQELHEQSVT